MVGPSKRGSSKSHDLLVIEHELRWCVCTAFPGNARPCVLGCPRGGRAMGRKHSNWWSRESNTS